MGDNKRILMKNYTYKDFLYHTKGKHKGMATASISVSNITCIADDFRELLYNPIDNQINIDCDIISDQNKNYIKDDLYEIVCDIKKNIIPNKK